MPRKLFKPRPAKDWAKIGIFSMLMFLVVIESIRAAQEFDKADTDIIVMVLSTLLGYCMKKVITEFKQK